MAITTCDVGTCCSALSLELPGRVSLPGTAAYTASLASYFSAQEATVHPACIVSPQSAQEVSRAVYVLTTTTTTAPAAHGSSASPAGCPFAVRSGGHALHAGAANMAQGVTIDLSGLSSVEVPSGTDARVVSAGVGTTWGSVYDYLDDLHLSVNGARSAGVGLGGLTLGGGISYFGPRYGWTCDTVANFEVVLANGTIVNANDDENPDLLWALRGGANNLGIVTRIDLQTFEQGDLWGGQVITDYSTADDQIAALAAFNEPADYDEYASLITTFAYAPELGLQVVVNNIEYSQPVANPPVFNTLTSMPALSSTQRIANITDLVWETETNNVSGLRQASATVTILSTVPAIRAAVDAWEDSLASVQDIPGIVWGLGMDPLPPQLYSQHAGSNALGLVGRQGVTLIVVHLTMTWSNASDDAAVDLAARDLIGAIERDTDALGALDPYIYINYAAPWQLPIESYGAASVAKLRRVRNAYDPTRVFTNLVPGGFKIPESSV
ncbi:hypothetical protein S7711_06228 [Stachybotrys chartarum IBT 7711]|uniref:FAD-binding PCMH-type domain-containing protein n=1 Tax=Stachybotrys chartarum (strain CBS 109288 / IBT 7711) TaxID=1280523 RepID=A0A084AWC1_STACB|nr:hypothetical protein S7711_06228 [Stachybotrys chartarum IBT 7711]KFA45833.1 hypothetical protein S40293_09663 [Stachybotrys chartarum IBT 40293]